MRARPPQSPPLLLLLLAVVAAITVAIPTSASPLPYFLDSSHGPLLLVARSVCQTKDPTLFSQESFERYANTNTEFTKYSRPYRLLSYEDTCGAKWESTVTLHALAVLSAGGALVCSGRPGVAVCNSVTAAAQALRRPLPPKCSETHARATAVVELARILGWRRALLWSTSDTMNECTAALLDIEHALANADVLIKYIPLHIHNTRSSFIPHVIILCDLSIAATNLAVIFNSSDILLLQVADAKQTSRNTSLQGNVVPTPGINDYFNFSVRYKRSFKQNTVTYSLQTENINILNSTNRKIKTFNNNDMKKKENKTNSNINERRDLIYMKSDVNIVDLSLLNRLLLLSDDIPSNKLTPQTLYDEVLEATLSYFKAETARTDISHNMFILYKNGITNETFMWRHLATLETKSTRLLDEHGQWETTVLIDNTDEFKFWRENRTTDVEEKTFDNTKLLELAIFTLCVICVICVCPVALVVALAKRSAIRHTPRRTRAIPILAAADFQFPADERRRVGEGMETMLSWLQQLHEFAGPEPERPDLLKQPELLGHSAPSSTCSVTRLAPDNRTRYKGDPVHMKYLPAATIELRRKTVEILLVMQSLRHENLNPFIGCLTEIRPALVFEACGRGSLEDVLIADDIRLDWTFRLSLLTDLVRGMRYLHASPVRVHARLSSRNCVVDSRWVLRITDFGLPAFASAQALPYPPRVARDLLWTAPEILREANSATVPGGTQPGDVYSFAIIMQEVIVRGEPYCMLSLTPEEIVEKLSHPPPLIRPSVSMSAAPPEAVSVMRQCWSEQCDLRPDFNRLYEIFRHMHRGRKVNIVDSMFEMLEKYSNNLEELIKERTDQLDMEKKKTEQLLNRMLPRSVAERLMLGLRVEPEEFEEVSIYFSDIVGFTSLAARSTPVQVVDLLNDLYTTFDAAIEQYRVYKVETIGDAYMVVGGLPIRSSDHAENIATMALHLLHLAGRFRIRHLPATPLHLRIGLHTGACCAGVVGLTMPRYCLFGDTVNTASRMESTGAAWRIQVSAATADRLVAAGGYRLRSRGLTQVKGKGAMHTYWLLGKDGFDKSLPSPPPLESEEVLFETEAEDEIESESACTGEVRSTAAQSVERQRSDPSPTVDKFSWQRSGAVSAESSPPPPTLPKCRYLRSSVSTVAGLLDTPRLSDRWSAPGARTLRRQWSLERGDALAAAAAETPATESVSAAAATLAEPLALRAAPARPPLPRYRTRRDTTSMLDVSDR